MMKMIFGEDAGKEYSPMLLREHARDADLQRIIEMLDGNKPLMDLLVALSYTSKKSQKDLTEFFQHAFKLRQLR